MNFTSKIHHALRNPLNTTLFSLSSKIKRKKQRRYLIGKDVSNFVQTLLSSSDKTIDSRIISNCLVDLDNTDLFETVEKALEEWKYTDSSGMRYRMAPTIYVLVKLWKPKTVVETGVASGVSSLFILRALAENNRGKLFSIDISNEDGHKKIMTPNLEPGWIIPEKLKLRWELTIGDSKVMLPSLLKRIKHVDIFLHDSLHTYSHMIWEYKKVWPYLVKDGILLSDDVNWNKAFFDFSKSTGNKPCSLGALGAILKK